MNLHTLLENGSTVGRFQQIVPPVFSNMIIDEKNGSTFQKRDHFPKKFAGEAIFSPLFSVNVVFVFRRLNRQQEKVVP